MKMKKTSPVHRLPFDDGRTAEQSSEGGRRSFLRTGMASLAGAVFVPAPIKAGHAVRRIRIPTRTLDVRSIGVGKDLAG